MFNKDRKYSYINYKNSRDVMPYRYLEREFERVEKFEERYGKDICDFNAKEIEEYYRWISSPSASTIITLNSQFRMYAQWCLENNIVKDSQNHFDEITRARMSDCLNKSVTKTQVITRSQLIDYNNMLPNAREKFIALAIFELGKSKDMSYITNMKLSDINCENLTVKLPNGKEPKISSTLYALALEANSEIEYHAVGAGANRIIILTESNCIINKYPNDKSDTDVRKGRNLYFALKRAFDVLGEPNMTPSLLADSGKIHMIKTNSSKLNLSPLEYMNLHKKEINDQFNCNLSPSLFALKYKDYL